MQMRDPSSEMGLATAARPQPLLKRSEFLHAAGGRKAHAALFTVQMRPRDDGPEAARIGLTITRKVGSAVERNRIRRRLREVIRLDDSLALRPQHDYVIVARRDLLSAPFSGIAASLRMSVAKVHGVTQRPGKTRRPQS